MARRNITATAERKLAQQAEANRDDPSVEIVAVPLRVSVEASAVLSVRLPIDQIRTLRGLASARGISLSTLIHEAVQQLLSAPPPRVTVSQSVKRVYVAGALADMSAESEPTGTWTQKELEFRAQTG
jgi:hypothetical protein